MTGQSRVGRAFADHDAFEAGESGYESTATPFEAVADAERVEDEWRFRVVVTVPTIRAAVDGEVGDAVANGWYETFELRLEDAYGLVRTDRTDPPEVERDPDAGAVHATFGFGTDDPRQGVDDAAAVVDYVEGTYVQGVIPGYDYVDPVAGLLAEARRAGQGGADPGAGRSGSR